MDRALVARAAALLALAACAGCIHVERPSVIEIVPAEGQTGTVVTIHGNHFIDDFSQTKVFFAGLVASPLNFVSIDETEIRIRVPAGAVSGDVVVSVGGVESGRAPFRVFGPWLLVGTHDVDGITVFDTHTGLVESVVPMAGPPVDGRFSGDGSTAWLIGEDAAGGFANRFDPTDRSVGDRVGVAADPVAIAFDSIVPDVFGFPITRSEAWVTHGASGTVELVESSKPSVRTSFDAGAPVTDVELSIDGRVGFLLQPSVPAVVLYDSTLGEPTVLATLPLGPNPGPLLYDEIINRAFVLERADAKVAFVDPSTKTITNRVAIGPDPIDMIRSGNTLYVLSRTNHTVDMVDGSGATVFGTIPVANDATRLATLTTTNESLVWVATESGTLHGYDQTSMAEVATVSVDPNIVDFRSLVGTTGTFLLLAQDVGLGQVTIVDRPQTRIRTTGLPGHPTRFVIQPGA